MTRVRVAAVVTWLAAVLLISGVTWIVVSRVGNSVGAGNALGNPAIVPGGDVIPIIRITSSPTLAPSVSPSRTPSVTPSASTKVPTPPTVRPTTAKPSPAPVNTTPQQRSTTRTFVSDAGSIQVTCSTSTLRVDAIRPRDGWEFRQEREDGQLEVKFTRGEAEVEVTVRCIAGVPTQVG